MAPQRSIVLQHLTPTAVCDRSREATTFNGRAFVKEVVQEFGVMPTVRLYNCLLDLYVARKEPVANLLALLKQMKVTQPAPKMPAL